MLNMVVWRVLEGKMLLKIGLIRVRRLAGTKYVFKFADA